MNNELKEKLINILKTEAEELLQNKEPIIDKLSKMDDIDNMLKIIANYDNLKPVFQKYFAEKHKKEKWGKNDER